MGNGWNFMRNIINIDTFFKDPHKQYLEEQKKKEYEEEAHFMELKNKMVHEASEKAAEQMMLSLDEDPSMV